MPSAFTVSQLSPEIRDRMSLEQRLALLFNFYREAEMHGARLLLNLHRHITDGDSQIKLTRHLSDECRHAWLWTQRIDELGAAPIQVGDGYQSRLGRKVGLPRHAIDLLALTLIAESRAIERYQLHAKQPGVDARTLEVLKAVSADEPWHLSWVGEKMKELAPQYGGQAAVDRTIEKYRAIEREVYQSFLADETFLMGK